MSQKIKKKCTENADLQRQKTAQNLHGVETGVGTDHKFNGILEGQDKNVLKLDFSGG